MMITNRIQTINGLYTAEYHDADSFDALPAEKCSQAYGVCFYNDLIILAKTKKGSWTLPGGTIEPGESFYDTLIREIREESNMKVLNSKPLGYQKVWSDTDPLKYQLRYYCKVEPYGLFTKDLADDGGNIDSIQFTAPDQAANLLDWGEIGNHIIERAISLHQ